jgi:hypothetical protein
MRTWVKIHCDKWVRGPIRKEPIEVRAVWVDILAMAGDSAFGNSGIIAITENFGYNDEAIAGILNISDEVWQQAKQRLVKTDRIKILKNNVIEIVNWNIYQDEYQRQKPYREEINPDVRKLIRFYSQEYIKVFGEKPLIDWKKSGNLLKKALKIKPAGEIADMIITFLKNPTGDKFIETMSKSLSVLLSDSIWGYFVNKYSFEEINYEIEGKNN